MNTPTKVIVGVALLGIVAIKTIIAPTPSATPEAEADQQAIKLAEAACRIEFERIAHDPSSVDWLRAERQAVFAFNKDGSQDKAKITSIQPVRAKNKLGALVRSVVACDVIKQRTHWNVVTIKNKI